jgi:hypothetical protein
MLLCGVAARIRRPRKFFSIILELRWYANRLDSADASIGGEATGAMSYAFISSLRKNPNQSYVQLLNSIRDELEGKYDQKPQLSCSHPLSKLHITTSFKESMTNEPRHGLVVRHVNACPTRTCTG